MQCDHIDAEDALHGRLFVEVIEHDLANFARLQLDNNAHTVFVRLIT